MGGYGSGRPGYKRKAEHLRSLDVNRLFKAGHLKQGHQGGWQWTRDGEQVASIGTKGDGWGVKLIYRVTPYGGTREDIEERVTLTWQDCPFGGQRPYFICPGIVNGRACNRRVAKLYLGQRYFLCRHCNRLSYACQSETRADRMLRGANKLRMAMGGEPGLENCVRKPKGMHWATYWRNIDKIERADHETNLAFIRFVQRRFPGGFDEFLT
jgi:hypothetical protein